MKLLLDTHTIMWFLNKDAQLSETSLRAIENPANTKYVSMASLWEMAIKINLGKLEIRVSLSEFETFIKNKGIHILALAFNHIDYLQNLPYHHKDPFDRLLIAQAKVEQMAIISKDKEFHAYDIQLVWN